MRGSGSVAAPSPATSSYAVAFSIAGVCASASMFVEPLLGRSFTLRLLMEDGGRLSEEKGESAGTVRSAPAEFLEPDTGGFNELENGLDSETRREEAE